MIQIEMKTGPHQKKTRSCLEMTQKMNSCLIATSVSSTPYRKTSWKLILNGNIKDKSDPMRGNTTAVFYLLQKRSPSPALKQLTQIKPDWSVKFAIIKLGIILIWRDLWENIRTCFLVSITNWLMSKLFDYWINCIITCIYIVFITSWLILLTIDRFFFVYRGREGFGSHGKIWG